MITVCNIYNVLKYLKETLETTLRVATTQCIVAC